MTMPSGRAWRWGILAAFAGVLLPATLILSSRFMPPGEIGSAPSLLSLLWHWVYLLLWPSSMALPHLTGVYDPDAIRRALMLSIAGNGVLYGMLGFAFGWLVDQARKAPPTS
jgi:hypothetical protein